MLFKTSKDVGKTDQAALAHHFTTISVKGQT